MAQKLTAINRKMVEAIEKMKASATPEIQNEVFSELANNARFVVPVKVEGEPSKTQPKDVSRGSRMQFPVVKDKSGKAFFMAFTDKNELKKWVDYDGQTAEFTFDEYANVVRGNEAVSGFVINPFSSDLVVGRKMIEYLQVQKRAATHGMQAKPIDNDGISFSDPEVYPDEMIEAVTAYMRENKGIEEAYLRMMHANGEDNYAIVVSFTGDLDTVFGEIMDAARPHLKGVRLALIPASAAIARRAVADADPFYTKPLRIV